jgi:Protein of unknown function (DUF2892)
MIYRKNLYTWEQALRLIASVALIAYPLVAMPNGLLSYGLIATGVVMAVTGLFGYCPACAMFGKTLKTNK